MRSYKTKNLEEIAREARICVLEMIYRTKGPHIGSSFSCIEILVALYFKHMRVSEDAPQDPGRDRFVFSKGHACPALYAVLSLRGFLGSDKLCGFAVNDGCLQQHPDREVSLGIEVSTGSLGHGLSIACGMAYALKKDGSNSKVYVLLSDGELHEGSTWEAAMFASQHKLDNIIAIVDYNKMQALGRGSDTLELEPLPEKWSAFGWQPVEVDGHDFLKLDKALGPAHLRPGKPGILIAHTIKGKGVSFMENQILWHYRCPDEAEYGKAMEELSR